MPAFHLNNDSSCHYILLEQEMFKGSPAHYIAKIHYYGMYGEQYVQEQYFVFEESIVRCVYTSKQKKYDIHSS